MKYYPLLALLVLVAGCTGGLFGEDVIKVSEQTISEGPNDAIHITGIETIPRSPVLPGHDTTLFFTVENTDDTKTAYNVYVDLFNPSSFDIMDEKCTGVAGGCQFYIGNLLPGEQKQAQIKLKAPSEGDIAGVRFETDLNFLVQYYFESTTVVETLLVNEAEILSRQRQGQPVSLQRNNIVGSGPVHVESEIRGVSYVLHGQTQGAILVFKLVHIGDKGKGDLKGGGIDACNSAGPCVSLFFPARLGAVKCPDDNCGKFSCSSGSVSGAAGTVCVNSEEIKMFKGESLPSRFDIDTSGVSLTEPFRTENIRAEARYIYELRDSVHIVVNPLQNA